MIPNQGKLHYIMNNQPKPTAIVIAGPTAVGKTELAIWVARQFGTQILSADSRQCFRELNIGVARPSMEELAQVHHYFIGSHSIQEDMNAGIYTQYGLDALATIFKQNPVAVIVGGTGLYLKALLEGVDEMPSVPADIRDKIQQQYRQNGINWLQHAVSVEDPVFWAQSEQSNPQRLMRALAFKQVTGKSIMDYRTSKRVSRPFNVIKIGLELPRQELYERINQRVELMIAAGLEAEVRELAAFQSLNALQTVGYKEIFAYLDKQYSLEAAVSDIQKNTRHYAKRQMTWFKKDGEIQWFVPTDKEKILSCIKSTMNGNHPL